MTEQRRTVGVLGGKGPEATVELLRLIVAVTPARTEEEHLHVIVDNHPQIPKPALGITGEGPDPVPALTATAANLEKAGADFIVIPCNSAHYYVEQVRGAVSIPVVSIIDETVAAVKAAGISRVGLLATTGLVSSGIYQDGFARAGVEVLLPDDAMQVRMMDGILAFKDRGDGGPLKAALDELCGDLITRGAGGLVLGCTELPVVLEADSIPVPCYDTLEILARAAVREALGKADERAAGK